MQKGLNREIAIWLRSREPLGGGGEPNHSANFNISVKKKFKKFLSYTIKALVHTDRNTSIQQQVTCIVLMIS